MPDASRVRLKTALGCYPYLAPLREGSIADPCVGFDFIEVAPIPKAFAPMVRRLEYDLSEMAVVTALQAFAFRKPIILLPAVVASRFQRGCLIRHRDRPLAGPRALVGKTIGVRSFTQTTGMWVRAALHDDHGLLAGEMRWRVSEGAHLVEYSAPPFVEWDDSGKTLPDQLRDGDIAAAIMGADLPESPEFVPVLTDHAAADRAWHDVHRAREDAHCVVHTHTQAGMAVSALRCGLLPLTQMAMRFARVAYHDYEGVAVNLDEQERFVRDLGACDLMILRNHGLLAVGASIPETFDTIRRAELACATQLRAMATGAELIIPSEDVQQGTARLYQPDVRRPYGLLEWPALLRKLDRLDPSFRH